MAINKRKVLDAARKYAQKGAQAKALKEFDKLLKLDPRDARLRLEIGDAHRRWGNAAEAIETYTRVAEQYTKEGFDARAVAVYKQIHNLKPDAYDSYAPLAELYQRMGLDSEAVLALQTAADGFHKEGKKSEALELLRKMAMLDPTNTTSRIKVADLLRQEGLTEEAVSEYEEAGAELERQGDTEAATGVYERILEVQPDRRETRVKLAETLVERGLADRAEPYVKRALEEEPDEPARYELMAAVYRLQKRDEELADVYRTLADLYRRRGDDEQAREILQRYVPTADFEEEEVGLGDQTAFEAMDSAVALGEASQPLVEGVEPESQPLASLADSRPLDSPVFDPDSSSAIDHDVLETDGDEVDYLSLDDAESVELELDEPLDSPAVEPAGAPPDIDTDPEQLLAEANVYLRYGKREQALANLEAIVARDPGHRVALEKLGETQAEAGQEAGAISSWLLAAEAARAEGDFDAMALLRDRICAIDPEAAKNLGPRVPEGESSGASTVSAEGEATVVSFDSFDSGDPNADSSTMSDSDREIDLDDIEIDIDDSEFADEIPGLADDDDEDDDGEVAAAVEEAAIPLEPTAEEEGGDTLDVASTAGDSDALGPGASAAMVQQIGEDLEEADFYMKQGLADEAEAIYQRVLSIAPNHPHALVRLGEVAALRGEDPSTSHPGISGPVEFEAGGGTSEDEVEAAEMSFREDIPGPDDAGTLSQEDSLSLDEPEPAPESQPELDAEPEPEPEAEIEVASEGGDEIEFESDADLETDGGASLDASFSEPTEDPADSIELDATESDASESDAIESESDLEDELASQFLAEVTQSDGVEVDPVSASDDGLSSEVPEEDPIEIDGDESDSTASESFTAESVASEDDASVSAAAEIASPDDSFVESGVDLGDAPEIAVPEPVEASAGEVMAASDDDASFDLAAELSDVFDDDDGNSGSGLGDSGDGFESVFNEFKKGVSRTLSEDDHEAHFDLGIAYREMGLFDDAKSEFRAAMLNSEREIQCRHMLGLCCFEQENYEEALSEFEQIAAAADATDEQQLSAQFELGRTFEGLGEIERARKAYEAVAEIDPSFCDVGGRLEKIDRPQQAGSENSSLESFDDLIADVEAGEDEGAVEVANDYESFGDLVAETESDDEDVAVAETAEEPEVESIPAPEPEVEVDEVAVAEEEAVDPAVASDVPAPDERPEPPRPKKRKKISFV